MPFSPTARAFRTSTGAKATRIATRINPPQSPDTELATLLATLYDTPKTAADKYCGALAGGPTGRVRLEVSINGGGRVALTSAGVAHGGTVGVQHSVAVWGVHLDNTAVDSEVASFLVFVKTPGADAGFLDSP